MKNKLSILILLIGINFTSFAQTPGSASSAAAQSKFIKCYPNPAIDVVNFEFLKGYNRSYSIRILNSIGKEIYDGKNIPALLTIDLREEKFYRGIYIYQLVDKNGVVIESSKFLVIN